MDMIFLKNSINIQKYLVSRYICKSILYLVCHTFLGESIVSVSRYIFKSIFQSSGFEDDSYWRRKLNTSPAAGSWAGGKRETKDAQ